MSADPKIRWDDEPGRCVNCEHLIGDDDDWMEDGNDQWCGYCWSKRPKDEESTESVHVA